LSQIHDLKDQYINVFQPYLSAGYENNPFSNTNSDWASIHYLAICQGNYESDGVTKTNITCSSSPSPESVFNLQRAFIPWVMGIVFTGFKLFLLLLFCGGRRHWNGWMMMFQLVRLPSVFSVDYH